MFRVLPVMKKTVAFGLFLLLMLAGALVHAQNQTINPSGGVSPDYSDGAQIIVGPLGDIQLIANDVGHLYSSASLPPNMGTNSVALRLAGPSGTRIYGRNNGNVVTVSQSLVTGSGTLGDPWQLVTTFRPNTSGADGNIRIIVTDRFVLPNLYFTRQIAVTSINAADTAKLYWYFDTMVGGNDSGMGYLSGTTVGTRHPTTLEKLEFRQNGSLTAWDRYFSGQYSSPSSQISSGSGDLNNVITTTPTDAGLAIQWTIPASSTSFTGGADLVYVPAGIFAREVFSPDSIMVGGNSRMTITLSSINTSLSAATFTYTLPPGASVAATPNLANTCAPGGGGTVTASGSSIAVTGLQLQAIVAGNPAYTCTISLDVSGTAVGFYTPTFASSDSSVGHRAYEYGSLDVTPIVLLEAAFSPSTIVENGLSKLIVKVSNRDASSAHNAQDFIYDTFDPNLITTASPPVVSSTCPGTPAVAVSGTQLTFSQINLPIAPSVSTPYQCQIMLNMTSPQEGYYNANYVSSTTGAAPASNASSPQLRVFKAVQVDALFNPAQTVAGAITRFEMTVTNSSLSPSSNVNFSYPFSSTDIQPAATPNLTSTCSPGGTITLSSTGVDVTSLVLNAATTAPYTCTIAFDVQISASASSNFYSASFNTPDQSAGSPTGYVELYLFTTPTGGANASMALEKPVIAANEPNSVTLTFYSNEPTPLSGLDMGYQFSQAVIPLGTPVTTCPAGVSLASSTTGFSVTGLSLPAAGATPYSCTATFRFTATAPDRYDIWLNNTSGPWYAITNSNKRFIVLNNFLPPVFTSVPVPTISGYGMLLLILALLGGGMLMRRR